MYGFVDTIESADITSMSIQTIFNGMNMDNKLTDADGSFRTLTVSGRDVVNRRIRTREVFGKDGDVEEGHTLDVRIITVKYMMSDRTSEGFRARFERLNGMLKGSQKALEFTDEEAYFTATLQGGDTPEEKSNSIVGTLSFLCSDPAKKREKNLTISDTLTSIVDGHKSTPWKTKTTFTEKKAGCEFQFNSPGKTDLRDINKIKLNYNFVPGDVLEMDFSRRRVTVNNSDITNTVVILQSNFAELPIGPVEFSSSVETDLFYNERYY